MTRVEKIREARRLRELGWTAPRIGRRLGVSDSTIRNWYLGGDCEDCGTPVTYDSAAYEPTHRCVQCERLRTEAQHGTRTKYVSGCSCDACMEANRAAGRALKGKTPPNHGYSGYVNYGCRCQRCRDGHLVYMRSKDWEHQRAWAAKVKGTEPPQHGTLTAYMKYACRCDACRRANTEHSRAYRARRANGSQPYRVSDREARENADQHDLQRELKH